MRDAATTADRILSDTLALCRLAKEERLHITPARVIDAVRSLAHVDWLAETDFRLALRTNLASSREQEIAFERVFDRFWRHYDHEDGDYKPWRPELIRGDKQYGDNVAHEEMLAEPEEFGAEEVSRRMNLIARWDDEQAPIERIIRELARKLATRPSRRTCQSKDGQRVDIRRSVRKNVRHGLDMLELAKTKKRTRKTRIVMLCDVSGSMDAFNPFLLQIMFGLQQELKNSRTLVFSTKVTEITSLLRRASVQQTLREIGDTVRHWSGGTDIGRALGELNRGALQEGSSRSTVAIIISDGYDNGSSELIEQEMRAMRRRVRTVVWINPMFGATTFQVRAAGMKAALPFVDHFLPAFNTDSLKILVRDLAKI